MKSEDLLRKIDSLTLFHEGELKTLRVMEIRVRSNPEGDTDHIREYVENEIEKIKKGGK